MSEKEIREMLNNLGYGEKPPEALMNIIKVFRQRKSAVFPMPMKPSDIVTATMIYDLAVSMKEIKNG